MYVRVAFLEHQDTFEALGGAVAHRVALLARAERPRPLGREAVRAAVVARILADLARVEPREDVRRKRLVLWARHEARVNERLSDERRVPELRLSLIHI